MSEAIQEHPELVKKYIGTVVPIGDNYYRHSPAVFTDILLVRYPKVFAVR